MSIWKARQSERGGKREHVLQDLTSDDSYQECSIKSRKMLGEGAWPLFFKGPVTHRGSGFQLRCYRAARAAPRVALRAKHTYNSLLYEQRERTAVTGDRSDPDRLLFMITYQWRCRARFLPFFRWIVSVCYGGISPQLSVRAPGQPTPMKSCSYMQSERLWSGIRFLCVFWIKILAGLIRVICGIFPLD